jgi:hypothetical protein
MDPIPVQTSSTLVAYALQQGPAFAVLAAVCVGFVLAIRKLFADAKEERVAAALLVKAERDAASLALEAARREGATSLAKAHEDCRQERKEDRAVLAATLDKLSGAITENTRATERLTDRLAPATAPGRAA